MTVQILPATDADFDVIWPIFKEVARAGETYAYDRNISKLEAKQLWMRLPRKTFIAKEHNKVVGTYYIKTNQAGPGEHVCNCGYMVASDARGKGLASMMCEHSQEQALAMSYKAMQYNFVASSNHGAIRIWEKHGFDTVGVLPNAFNHPSLGLIDALVMYKWL